MNDLDPDLDYLSRMYPLIGPYIVAHGQSFHAQRAEKVKKRRDKECFRNASNLATARGWTYCEGFAQLPDFPEEWVHHAWCIDESGNVVDPTWRPTALAYFGVTIDGKTELRLMNAGCHFGQFLERLAAES